MTKKEILSDEYRNQRRRIQQTIRRLKKQGYVVDYELPSIPKQIREGSIRRLEKIKPSDIREKSTFVDVTTGERVEGWRTQTIRKLRKGQKEMIDADPSMEAWIKNNIEFLQDNLSNVTRGTFDNIVADFDTGIAEEELIAERIIQVFSDDIYETGNPRGISIIMFWLEDFIARKGKIYVADVLREASERNIQLNITPYSSDEELYGECQEFINRLIEIDPEGGQLTSDQYANFVYENSW